MDILMKSGPSYRAPNNDNKPDGMDNQLYRPPHYEFNQWRKEQIFTSMETANGIASGGVIPNIDDIVISFDGNRKIEERVTFVDPTTYLSTLEIVEYPKAGNDVTIGVPIGVGNLASAAILYFNPNDPRLGVEVDYRLPITGVYGSALSYARLFLGSNVGPSGTVVSVNYDAAGNIKNDRLNVELVDLYDDQSKRYIILPGCVDISLPEDTLVTLCLYNDADIMVSYQTLVVKFNGLVHTLSERTLFVNRVYLESAYLNPANDKEILIPKNLLSNSFVPRVFKEYNTGSREELFIGTSNVTLYGWGDHVNGEIGDNFPLVLNYVLSRNERSESVSQFTGNHITTEYRVRVVDSDIAVDVKLFVLPTYDRGDSQYHLKYWLYSGRRDTSIDVTASVRQQGFAGNKYGIKQTVDFSIDLTNIDGMPDVVFADTIDLMLMNEPMATTTMYRLWYYRDPERWFGENLRVKMMNHFGTRTIGLSNEITQKAEWLDRMYYEACPIYDPSVANDAPEPTYVDVTIGINTKTIDIRTYWNGETPWDKNQVCANGENVVLKWYTHNDSGDRLDLAITNLPLEYI